MDADMKNLRLKEAIDWFNKRKNYAAMVMMGAGEMFELAISALEFKGHYDQFWEEVKAAGMKGKETEIRHGGRVFRIREVAQ